MNDFSAKYKKMRIKNQNLRIKLAFFMMFSHDFAENKGFLCAEFVILH